MAAETKAVTPCKGLVEKRVLWGEKQGFNCYFKWQRPLVYYKRSSRSSTVLFLPHTPWARHGESNSARALALQLPRARRHGREAGIEKGGEAAVQSRRLSHHGRLCVLRGEALDDPCGLDLGHQQRLGRNTQDSRLFARRDLPTDNWEQAGYHSALLLQFIVSPPLKVELLRLRLTSLKSLATKVCAS